MPNLLPDWWKIRDAGRLIWFSLILVVGLTYVGLLIVRPFVKRPVPDKLAYALVPGIAIGTLVLGRIVTALQRTIVLAGLAALVVYSFMLVASRRPRDFDRPTTWGEAYGGALAVFALMTLAYAIIPHEWLTFANASLNMGDTSQFVFRSSEPIFGLVSHYPFNLDYPAVRDIVVTGIYVILLGLNLKLWTLWQRRRELQAPRSEAAAAPESRGRSRFGRPVRAWSKRAATTVEPS